MNLAGVCAVVWLTLMIASGKKFAKAKSAAIILDELSLDNNTLTPSMKVAPNNVLEKYKSHLQNLYGNNVPVEEEVYVVKLDTKKQLN